MIEDIKTIKRIRTVIKRSTNRVVKQVLRMHESLKGREEEITAQIASEITLHLLDEISFQLNNIEIGGIKFEIHLYKKNNEEPKTGADIAGILDIKLGKRRITKSYLAQAKVENISDNESKKEIIGFTNPDIQKQVSDMLNITNSAYVFIYSKRGVEVLSAQSVKALDSNKIRITKSYAHDIGFFYEEFLKCFIGDHKLIPYPVEQIDLKRFAEQTNVSNVLLIKGTKENDNKPKSIFSYAEI